MAKQNINQGTAPTGAGGDTFRSGSAKLQANDDEIYNYLGDGTNLNKLGTAAFKNVGESAGNVMGVGAFGIGVYDITALSYTSDSASSLISGNFKNGVVYRFSDDINAFTMVNSGVWKSQIGLHPAVGQLLFRQTNASGFMPWQTVYSTKNTTVDANGFIKSASPIVQLYADKIELNEEAKEQEITFEKLGTGDYLIKESSGFAQEGWYIETPKDANGNVLFSVIYAALENGDISIKTYKKKFDLETASIVADLTQPIDITENRWIDIRLQALPPINYEMPTSKTPADFQPTGIAQAVATVMESYHDPEQ